MGIKMNNIKQNTKIITLFALLIVVAATPLLLIESNNERILNKLNIVTIQNESMDDGHSDDLSSNYNITERIQIIRNAQTSKTGAVTEQQLSYLSDEEERSLINSMEAQLAILNNLGVLPKFEFSKEYNTRISKTTYINTLDPNNSVSVWYITVEYSDILVNVQMDTETSILYQVFISSYTDTLDYDPSQLSFLSFLNYLQIEPQNLNWEVNDYNARGIVYDNNNPIYYYDKSQYYINYSIITTMYDRFSK